LTVEPGRLGAQQGWSCYGTGKHSPGEVRIHFHMLFRDGVYVDGANGSTRFRSVRAPNGNVRNQFKTPYRDGTMRVIFEPMDFIRGLQLWCRNSVSAPNSQ